MFLFIKADTPTRLPSSLRGQPSSEKMTTPSLSRERSLNKLKSAGFVIGYRSSTNSRGKKGHKAGLSERLLENEETDATPEKMPLCDCKNDLINTKNMILGSWVNTLLIFVPFGVISGEVGWSAPITFFLNFLGMIPVASILGDATECLADHLGETIGGLLNATFGNAVEVKRECIQYIESHALSVVHRSHRYIMSLFHILTFYIFRWWLWCWHY